MEMIDLASPATWPRDVHDAVSALAEEISEQPGLRPDLPACDLRVLDHEFVGVAEERVRLAFGGRLVHAYHATRLLPHEEAMIRSEGLLVLSDELRDRKLAEAVKTYPDLIDKRGADLLRRSGPLTWGRGVRRGLVWVAAPLDITEDDVSGLRPLMERWGGEVIGWTDDSENADSTADDLVARIAPVSRPTLVEVAVGLDQLPEFAEVWWVAVGRLLGLPSASTEWALRFPVPPAQIIGLIQPGKQSGRAYFRPTSTLSVPADFFGCPVSALVRRVRGLATRRRVRASTPMTRPLHRYPERRE